MNKQMPSSLTLEEAVARMVNLDYIPAGCTLLEMTEAFQQEAEVELHNARVAGEPEAQLNSLAARLDACTARHALAQSLLRSLQAAANDGALCPSPETTAAGRYTVDSLSDWAADRYGIDLAEAPAPTTELPKAGATASTVNWEDVTIKIYADHRLAWRTVASEWQIVSFLDLGLIGKRKLQPNDRGDLLITLSEKTKFPPSRQLLPKHKTLISKLRHVLKRLTGIAQDPFLPPNEVDGWLPRFTLIDDRRNADDRAMQRAVHMPLSSTRDYAGEHDETDKWLARNDPKHR